MKHESINNKNKIQLLDSIHNENIIFDNGMPDTHNSNAEEFPTWQDFESSDVFKNAVCTKCLTNTGIVFDVTEDNIVIAMCCDVSIELEHQDLWAQW